MKYVLAALLLTTQVFGIYKVGDHPKDVCWDALNKWNSNKVCLSDAPKHEYISVLLHNAGWCKPCNQEFKELVPALEQFKCQNVTFISLSSSGWKSGSKPDETFLTEWEAKHKIDKAEAYWLVAASPRDSGDDYFPSPSIPNVVILDADGNIAFKAISPGVKRVVAEVKKLLSKKTKP